MSNIPDDMARCNGVWYAEGENSEWREGCETCLRRTAPRPADHILIDPPAIIAFECEDLIEPK